eukprot:gnl/TRDRNA2_/TRDRNA2_82853_c0_seq1.p1 gnl/TRDRNA2_/TRDRNA2_82853_c0~~gnl/TRDRNA2_/TRDRNA2_82853_c0_seq1.p1  ORF type:complete len:225 (+),score=33.68 gnl/TRDRNA2_/TRDRNA2_82853_c0_seq1:39-713(+)
MLSQLWEPGWWTKCIYRDKEQPEAATTPACFPEPHGQNLRCDRCDGPHETERCPHFRKSRDKHADAWTEYGKPRMRGNSSDSERPVVVQSARVVKQPGDGSCLFHSLSHGLGATASASALRQEMCSYMKKNPDASIADTTLKDWVRYDSGGDGIDTYASKMKSGGSWGGGIEMAVLTKMKNVNVHVYQKCSSGFKRISNFDAPQGKKTINVLYTGGNHYDALEL